MKTQEIEISIGIIKINSSYVCLRRNTSPYEKYIEFPGGKKNANEDISSCLVREIQEELNISLTKYKYLGFIKHLYKNVLIKINIFKIFRYDGEITSNENREIVLYNFDSTHEILPTHTRILNILYTPKLLKIISIESFKNNDNLDLSIYRFIRLRDISYDVYIKNVKEKIINANFTGNIIIDFPYNQSWREKYYGIHYKSSQFKNFNSESRDSRYIYSASCHTPNDILACNEKYFNFILISPLLDTYNEYPILGWSKFSELSLMSYCPTLALGGVSSANQDFSDSIKEYGFGIAGVSQI